MNARIENLREFTIEPSKTYASKANVRKAVASKPALEDLRFFIMQTEEGRFFPVFCGQEAVEAGVHFLGFNIVG